jgi:hypothetical protein
VSNPLFSSKIYIDYSVVMNPKRILKIEKALEWGKYKSLKIEK